MFILTESEHKTATKDLHRCSNLDAIEGLGVDETYAYIEQTIDRVGLLHVVITFTNKSFIDLGAKRVVQLENKQFYYGIGANDAG